MAEPLKALRKATSVGSTDPFVNFNYSIDRNRERWRRAEAQPPIPESRPLRVGRAADRPVDYPYRNEQALYSRGPISPMRRPRQRPTTATRKGGR